MILNSLSVKKLKNMCKENNYKGYSKLNKKDLILFINNKKTKDFKLNSLFDLIKFIKNGITINNLINKYNINYSKKGYLYEKLWDLLIKTGSQLAFNSLQYFDAAFKHPIHSSGSKSYNTFVIPYIGSSFNLSDKSCPHLQ